MTHQLTGRFWADDPADAARQARAWIHGEPALRLRTIARIAAVPGIGAWDVTVAVAETNPPSAMDEETLIAAYGGLPIE